jgi:hypothetical protein
MDAIEEVEIEDSNYTKDHEKDTQHTPDENNNKKGDLNKGKSNHKDEHPQKGHDENNEDGESQDEGENDDGDNHSNHKHAGGHHGHHDMVALPPWSQSILSMLVVTLIIYIANEYSSIKTVKEK